MTTHGESPRARTAAEIALGEGRHYFNEHRVRWCLTVGHGGIPAATEVEGDPYCRDCADGFAADQQLAAEDIDGDVR